ncbi:MAG: hypothetical protein PHP00_05395 [Thiotrichaceae bacterium]|nr:hypothetical protein [Thiotrichaceae bacterium]
MLITVEQATQRIQAGEVLLLAGDESLLKQLPQGTWIGGTIPYFMSETGGQCNTQLLFAHPLPKDVRVTKIHHYTETELEQIPEDAPENGFSVIIIPATSAAHVAYAQNAPSYPNIFFKPIIGWIAGVHLDQVGEISPKVFNGQTTEMTEQAAVVMHVSLPQDQVALINIFNLFEQGEGDEIYFEEEGFSISNCLVNGKSHNFAQYLLEKKVDIKYPLVADYCGAMVNVSFQGIDIENRTVNLYAPVFAHTAYKIAAPVEDYVSAFQRAFPEGVEPIFACNCILNYLYSELEGKKTGAIVGPMTFGEVAYQLLNQTLVYLEIKRV